MLGPELEGCSQRASLSISRSPTRESGLVLCSVVQKEGDRSLWEDGKRSQRPSKFIFPTKVGPCVCRLSCDGELKETIFENE